MLDLKGFYDMHIHSAPAPFERIGDSAEIALWCAEGGMGGIVIKSHFESTISKVHHARRAVTERFPHFKLFAGIALNRGVGGVNPGAVEIALEQGAKMVWLPTFDAANHARAYGGSGTYGFKAMTVGSRVARPMHESYTVLEGGRLTEEAKTVIELVAAYDAILASGHVSKEEIYASVDYALAKGVKRLMVTHPEFVVPNLDIDSMVELAKQGVYMELCAVNCFPMLHTVSLDRVIEMIRAVTPDRVVISSDSGQPWSARPPETLRVYIQCLYDKGIDETAIRTMSIRNPRFLLGVDEVRNG
jgi:hypothetical protein